MLQQYHDQYNSFVIHATFSIRRDELEAIEEVLQRLRADHDNKEFVVIKFNDKNKYFGYFTSSNSMVPYESSYVRLSASEYLVWFEGLQYHKPNVRSKIERPLHIDFRYPPHALSDAKQRDYLQDALNISGTNWRGFNAKSLPISVFYAYLVAEYYKEFQSLGLEEIDLEAIHPWFL
ncbi:MAG: hypothetical protein CUN55_15390 [Phototrophicales bacterium]|nr:MAG: hypothetical protein CUN55_15390 [Phototrophicales bacterium]